MALSTLVLGLVIAILTWPFYAFAPAAGIDPSWVGGLYMAAARGMDAGTQIVFSYGPLGFLNFPSLYEIDLGRLAFLWSVLVQAAFCMALLWAARRAFGLLPGVAVATFAAAIHFADPVLAVGAVFGAAALLDEWTPRARLAFAVAAGALAGMQLLGSLRAGPTLGVMAVAVLLGLPDRRRTFPAFAGAATLVFSLLWLITGQGLANLDDYAANTASVLSGYSASMVYVVPAEWWQVPAFVLSITTLAVLSAAAVWRRDRMRRLGLALLVASVTFVLFKHAIVRSSPGSAGVFLAAALAVGLGLAPHVPRSVAITCIAVLAGLTYLGNRDGIGSRLDFGMHAESFVRQVGIVVTPGRAAEEQLRGREAMQAFYALTPRQLALLRSGTAHVATLEAGVAYAYELDWNPLPVFQQYAAYTERLDLLNAGKLDSATAPDRILWENAPAVDPTFVDVRPFPGTIDERLPAWDSPAQVVEMLCHYRVEDWDERWAVLRRSADRCREERSLGSVVAATGEAVPLPPTRHDEALVVRVDGLAVAGVERLRALLFRAARRNAILGGRAWNVIPGTAGDGLLLRIPRWADYPGKFALGAHARTVSFAAESATLSFGPSEVTLDFSALPLEAPAIMPFERPVQKRRVQR
jgi:hypothetical protein